MRGGIFVPHRRGDSASIAGRLPDNVAQRFGADLLVFRASVVYGIGERTYNLRHVLGEDSWRTAA
ncbi:MAG: hypothetical protein LC733_02595 [Actinobacteria bacterium]|nr:hypothetical protein [Actinomycetota bacterium]